MRALNILHTVEFYHPHTGGAEFVVQQVSERLAARGHRVTVATTALPERTELRHGGVNIVGFDAKGNSALGYRGADLSRYRDFLRNGDFDLVMHYAAQQWASDLAFDPLPMTRYRRVNILAPCGYSALSNARTLREPAFMPYFNKTLPRVLPLFDACVYHSSTYQDHAFATLLGLTNSVVIPNAVDAAEFEAPSALSFRAMHGIKEKHLLLCVANFFPKKGHDRVIDCFRAMKSKDTVLVFIGKEGEELGNLRKAAEGLNVRFCVGIPREQTVAAYREADLFLFGSYIEASPLVIIEAKASRTAFVSTDCGNVKEWKGGIVCAPEEMAMHAGRLLVDDAERKALAEEGWREWKDRLTWDAVITQYEDLYLRLCDEKARFIRKNTLLTSMPLEDKIARCQSNIERDYTDPYWYLCAAGFAEEAGRKDDALRYLEDALELDPTDTGLRERFEQAKVSV